MKGTVKSVRLRQEQVRQGVTSDHEQCAEINSEEPWLQVKIKNYLKVYVKLNLS